MNPTVKSEANLFVAPKSGSKEVISLICPTPVDTQKRYFSIEKRSLQRIFVLFPYLIVSMADNKEDQQE